MKLSEALQECTLALLRRIAQNHSIPSTDDLLRNELASLIEARFSEDGYLSRYLSGLPPEEIEVLSYLASHEWQGKAFLLERQFAHPAPGATAATPSLTLLQKGMLFRTFGVIEGWRGEIYHVPDEIRSILALAGAAERGQRPAGIATVQAPPIHEQRDPVFDLFCLLSYLRRADRRSQKGFLSRGDVQRVELESSRGQPSRDPAESERHWRFLLRVCLAGGWVWRDGPFLRPGRAATRLLSEPRSRIRGRLLDRYLRERSLSDLAELGRFMAPSGSKRIDESSARQMLLHHLQELAGNGWVTEDALITALQKLNPDFLREDYASLGSALVDAVTEVEVHGPASWMLVEGEWSKYVLRGPLYWLGVVRWGRNPMGERIAFQLIPPDEGGGASPGEMAKAIELFEDASVFARDGCDLGLLYRLEPYMLFKGSDAEGRSYRFTSGSVQQGVDAGGSLADLLDLVARASVAPASLVEQLRRWATWSGRPRLEGGVLLSTGSEDEMRELRDIPGVASCLGDPAGPTSCRVRPARFHQLVAALRDAGRPPLLDPSVGSTRARGLTGDESLVRECLFAIMVLRSLYGQVELERGEETQRALEAVLGPEASDEVARRAQDTARKIRSLGEPGW